MYWPKGHSWLLDAATVGGLVLAVHVGPSVPGAIWKMVGSKVSRVYDSTRIQIFRNWRSRSMLRAIASNLPDRMFHRTQRLALSGPENDDIDDSEEVVMFSMNEESNYEYDYEDLDSFENIPESEPQNDHDTSHYRNDQNACSVFPSQSVKTEEEMDEDICELRNSVQELIQCVGQDFLRKRFEMSEDDGVDVEDGDSRWINDTLTTGTSSKRNSMKRTA